MQKATWSRSHESEQARLGANVSTRVVGACARGQGTRTHVRVCVCVCVCARLGNGWKIDNGVAGPGRSIPPCLLARDFPPKISQSVDNRRAPSISRRSPLSSQTVPLRFHVSLSSFLAIAFTYPRDDISSDDDTIG